MARATKRLLADSLRNLLNHKTLDKITIKEICEGCDVNRQTFYYNFQDVYDLVDWILQDDLEKVIKDDITYGSWQNDIRSILQYALENKKVVLNAFYSISRPSLERYFRGRAKPVIRNIVDERSENVNISREDKDFIADIYSMSLVGIICEWIESGMRETNLPRFNKFLALMDGGMDYAVAKFAR